MGLRAHQFSDVPRLAIPLLVQERILEEERLCLSEREDWRRVPTGYRQENLLASHYRGTCGKRLLRSRLDPRRTASETKKL